ncbi:MAG: hypothetical protein KC503_01745, partial [Myxococcales bacterium]|nr:hypothetical protein [Myxococcales bacterium]
TQVPSGAAAARVPGVVRAEADDAPRRPPPLPLDTEPEGRLTRDASRETADGLPAVELDDDDDGGGGLASGPYEETAPDRRIDLPAREPADPELRDAARLVQALMDEGEQEP